MPIMKDVAEYADVSIATVSKYLNGGNVLDENEEKIKKAIEKLDYRVNEIARSLKTNKSMTVGVLIPSFKNIFFTNIVSYIQGILHEKRYSTIVCEYKNNTEIKNSKIDFFINKMVDGIILVPHGDDKKIIKKVKQQDINLILIDRMISGIDCDTVLVDNVNGSYKAVENLFQKGHSKVGIITGPEKIYTSRGRLKGYKRVHEDYNIKIKQDLIKYGNYEVQGGYEKTREVWEYNSPLTALFVTNYEMTIGALMFINERNIKVPRELSIIGFDDIMQLSSIFRPSLSIVSQPMKKLGQTAAELLLKRLNGDNSNYPEVKKMNTEVLIKGSVANLK